MIISSNANFMELVSFFFLIRIVHELYTFFSLQVQVCNCTVHTRSIELSSMLTFTFYVLQCSQCTLSFVSIFTGRECVAH
jgi:hypothetical protein